VIYLVRLQSQLPCFKQFMLQTWYCCFCKPPNKLGVNLHVCIHSLTKFSNFAWILEKVCREKIILGWREYFNLDYKFQPIPSRNLGVSHLMSINQWIFDYLEIFKFLFNNNNFHSKNTNCIFLCMWFKIIELLYINSNHH